jgi:hypothetical protein
VNALLRSALIVWNLPSRGKLLLLEAWGELLRAGLIIRTPFRSSMFDTTQSCLIMRSDSRKSLDALDYYLDAAARHHVFPIHCLEKALARQRMYQRRGIPCRLEIGFRREANNTFAGHAWLSSAIPEPVLPGFSIMKREPQ